jgi:hypothetical protein
LRAQAALAEGTGLGSTLSNVPPLNQTLWTLLIGSLCAFAGWGIVHLTALADRKKISAAREIEKAREIKRTRKRPRFF